MVLRKTKESKHEKKNKKFPERNLVLFSNPGTEDPRKTKNRQKTTEEKEREREQLTNLYLYTVS